MRRAFGAPVNILGLPRYVVAGCAVGRLQHGLGGGEVAMEVALLALQKDIIDQPSDVALMP